MPQKKNSDMAELVRGKTGRVYGNLIATLTMLKGLPLAYNKDMQEDKEAVFDSVDTVKMCLDVFAPMVATMEVHADAMYKAAQGGFINATDLADYLVGRGEPFRTAYKTVGGIVAYAVREHTVLDAIPLDVYKQFDANFEADLYDAIRARDLRGKAHLGRRHIARFLRRRARLCRLFPRKTVKYRPKNRPSARRACFLCFKAFPYGEGIAEWRRMMDCR